MARGGMEGWGGKAGATRELNGARGGEEVGEWRQVAKGGEGHGAALTYFGRNTDYTMKTDCESRLQAATLENECHST